MGKTNGEFEEVVIVGLGEIRAELRRMNECLGRTETSIDVLNELQHLRNERQELLSERQNLLHEQLVATDKKLDRVITALSTLLDKVERLS